MLKYYNWNKKRNNNQMNQIINNKNYNNNFNKPIINYLSILKL